MMEHSKYFERVKKWYMAGKWNAKVVREAVERGWITQEECEEILAE